jgi:predicted ATP-grasp superfamily ATP-dependent carboligase
MIAVGQIIKEAKSFKVSFFEIDEMPEVTALSLKEFTSADRKYLLESL